MRFRYSKRLAFLVLAIVVMPSGCNNNPAPPRLVPVGGKVVYKKKPVTQATVQFHPDAANGAQGFSATGQTKEDGTFTLQTYPHGPGAAPGRYAVTVTLEARGAGIPRRYASVEQTPLRNIEIKDVGAPDLLLRLTD
jgi:hypothetical protein